MWSSCDECTMSGGNCTWSEKDNSCQSGEPNVSSALSERVYAISVFSLSLSRMPLAPSPPLRAVGVSLEAVTAAWPTGASGLMNPSVWLPTSMVSSCLFSLRFTPSDTYLHWHTHTHTLSPQLQSKNAPPPVPPPSPAPSVPRGPTASGAPPSINVYPILLGCTPMPILTPLANVWGTCLARIHVQVNSMKYGYWVWD